MDIRRADIEVLMTLAENVDAGIDLKSGPVPFFYKCGQHIKFWNRVLLPDIHSGSHSAVKKNLSAQGLYINYERIYVRILALFDDAGYTLSGRGVIVIHNRSVRPHSFRAKYICRSIDPHNAALGAYGCSEASGQGNG
jgi:hypothetical protein